MTVMRLHLATRAAGFKGEAFASLEHLLGQSGGVWQQPTGSEWCVRCDKASPRAVDT